MFSGALAGAQQEVADALDLAGGARGYTREQVDEVRMVLRLGPILLLSVAYWTIYTQMASVFVLQVLPPLLLLSPPPNIRVSTWITKPWRVRVPS